MKELSNLLSIEIHDWMQDWDIECADASRIEEFCDVYENRHLTFRQKTELMKLIIASFDDGLHEKHFDFSWEKVARFLQADSVIHRETIEYWSLIGEKDEKNVFKVTPLIRNVWTKISKK